MAGVIRQNHQFELGQLWSVHEDNPKYVVEFVENGGLIGRVNNLKRIGIAQNAWHAVGGAYCPRLVL